MSEKHTPEQLALANEIAQLAEQRNAVFLGAVITAITKSAMQARIAELEQLLVDTRATADVIDHRNQSLTAQVERLRKVAANLFGYIEDGTLVRDITKDGESDWALKMMRFTADLQAAQTVLAETKEGK